MPGADEWNTLLSHVSTMVANAPSNLQDVSQFQDFQKGAGDLQTYATQLQNVVQQNKDTLGPDVSDAADRVATAATTVAGHAQTLADKAGSAQLTDSDKSDIESAVSTLQSISKDGFPELGKLF